MLAWDELEKQIEACKKCELYSGRNRPVLERGNRQAMIMLIGEGPGEEEDRTGYAFVGAAGRLLDSLINATGFSPDDFYIANIVKCRPPGNRVPSEIEAQACISFLRNQAFLVSPRIIVCLGATAAKYILKEKEIRITKERGIMREKNGFYYMPTYHPAALLRDPSKKSDMYEDFKKVRELYERLKAENT